MSEIKERAWQLGFGPVTLQPGETRQIDMQPKCEFRGEKILSSEQNAGVELSRIFIGQKVVASPHVDLGTAGAVREVLADGRAFREIPVTHDEWSDSALTMTAELVNHDKVERKVDFEYFGKARM